MTSIQKPNRPCTDCNKPHNGPSGRCAPCQTTANAAHNANRAYYHTTEWANLRAWIVDRDYHQCVVCAAPTTLHVHHVIARKDGGPDAPHNLITLCSRCHNRAENYHKETGLAINEYMRILKAQP